MSHSKYILIAVVAIIILYGAYSFFKKGATPTGTPLPAGTPPPVKNPAFGLSSHIAADGGAAKTTVQQQTTSLPQSSSAGTIDQNDLNAGCTALLTRLKSTNADIIQNKFSGYTQQITTVLGITTIPGKPYDTTLFGYLLADWQVQIKQELGQVQSTTDLNNYIAGINKLYGQINTLGTGSPQITYTNAANSLVWWDVVIRQTLIAQQMAAYSNIVNTKTDADANYTLLIKNPWLKSVTSLTTLLLSMGKDTTRTDFENHEKQAWAILASNQPHVDPSNSQNAAIQAQNNANNQQALKTTLTIISIALAFA